MGRAYSKPEEEEECIEVIGGKTRRKENTRKKRNRMTWCGLD
jgi:hypothetical protein